MTRFSWAFAGILSLSLLACDEEEPDGSETNDSVEGDGDADSVDGDGDAGDGDEAMEGDAFCAHATSAFAALDDYITVMNELSLTGEEVPVSRINENGTLAVGFAEEFAEEIAQAADFVVDDDAAAAFDALLVYQADYMLPQAELAAAAASDLDYSMASLELLQEDGVAEAAANGAVASGTVRAYAVGRCGSI